MYAYKKDGVPVAAVIIEPIQAEGGKQGSRVCVVMFNVSKTNW